MEYIPGGSQYRRNFTSSDRFTPYDEFTKSYLPSVVNPKIKIKADFSKSYSKQDDELTFVPIEWYRENKNRIPYTLEHVQAN